MVNIQYNWRYNLQKKIEGDGFPLSKQMSSRQESNNWSIWWVMRAPCLGSSTANAKQMGSDITHIFQNFFPYPDMIYVLWIFYKWKILLVLSCGCSLARVIVESKWNLQHHLNHDRFSPSSLLTRDQKVPMEQAKYFRKYFVCRMF